MVTSKSYAPLKTTLTEEAPEKTATLTLLDGETPIMNISIDIIMLKPQAALVKMVSMLQKKKKIAAAGYDFMLKNDSNICFC